LRGLGPAAIGTCFVLSSLTARAENTAETRPPAPGSATNLKSSSASATVAPGTVAAGESQTGHAADTPASAQAAAEAAYQRAQAEYANKNLKGALENMRESYRLCQRPELLYNLALLERELHECSLALADYTAYLQQVPQGRYREAAEQASAELSRECPAPPAAVPAPSAAPPPAEPPRVTNLEPAPPPELITSPNTSYWTPAHVIGWSAVGAGVLAGVGALYFRVAAGSAHDQAQRNVDAAYAGKEHFDQSLDLSLRDKQHRDVTMAEVLGVSGAALVAGGALVLIFGSKDAAHAPATAELQAVPGWLGVCYGQRF